MNGTVLNVAHDMILTAADFEPVLVPSPAWPHDSSEHCVLPKNADHYKQTN
jgi:hypothetical protein